jgi:hypothetical protein
MRETATKVTRNRFGEGTTTTSVARLLVRVTAMASAALLVALTFGGCGEDGNSECSHCCACSCTGADNCSGQSPVLSDSCMDCDEACPAYCSGIGCAYAGGYSCDNEPNCSCSCQCADCPTEENTAGPTCVGYECPTCAALCRDACMALGCQQVQHFSGNCGTET